MTIFALLGVQLQLWVIDDRVTGEVILCELTITNHTVAIIDQTLRCLKLRRLVVLKFWFVELERSQNGHRSFLHENTLLQVLKLGTGIEGFPAILCKSRLAVFISGLKSCAKIVMVAY